uniref:Vitamin K-dependent gamma-carboxylase lumenal domain-containing protein n=1 Tax=Timema genevievae TaxID=629358 RepID=A0A7R9K503_TIMGE|nr:unnamed protein product [Timema genevievae]
MLHLGYNNWTKGLYGYSWDMMVHSWDTILVVVKVVDNDTGKEHFIDPDVKSIPLSCLVESHMFPGIMVSTTPTRSQRKTVDTPVELRPYELFTSNETIELRLYEWFTSNETVELRLYELFTSNGTVELRPYELFTSKKTVELRPHIFRATYELQPGLLTYVVVSVPLVVRD